MRYSWGLESFVFLISSIGAQWYEYTCKLSLYWSHAWKILLTQNLWLKNCTQIGYPSLFSKKNEAFLSSWSEYGTWFPETDSTLSFYTISTKKNCGMMRRIFRTQNALLTSTRFKIFRELKVRDQDFAVANMIARDDGKCLNRVKRRVWKKWTWRFCSCNHKIVNFKPAYIYYLNI